MGKNKKAYARVILRVRAVFIDSLLFLVLLSVGGVLLQQGYLSKDVFRVWVVFLVASIFFYDPLFVSIFGSTIGQYFSNLHVEDANTGGKIDFIRAVFRYFIKFFFGWASFVTMKITGKLQAFHDLLTHSVVLIKNLDIAETTQYSFELLAPEIPGIPSRLRRSIVIFLYFIFLFLVEAVSLAIFVSTDCLEKQASCSIAEKLSGGAIELSWPFLVALVIYMGWRGRLLGCRRRLGDEIN